MALLAIDIGGTKIALGIFTPEGILQHDYRVAINARKGKEVGALITEEILKLVNSSIYSGQIHAIGICVPGISRRRTGTVWAPNIEGWEDYPSLNEVQAAVPQIPVTIESDRACYILGETWKGNAVGCSDAIFFAVGTGIGLGILSDGTILGGAHGISGAVGWMALDRPFIDAYSKCGCLEYHASGSGIANRAREEIQNDNTYAGILKDKAAQALTSHDVFEAFEQKDPIAAKIIDNCIGLWGMAIANLVSFMNPEKIIFGGGVFGPATKFIPQIRAEAAKWAQPVSIGLVTMEPSLLGVNAGVYGAGHMALQLVTAANNRRS